MRTSGRLTRSYRLCAAIYCSDLKRAHTTASCIHQHNKSTPHPPLTVSPLLREQFFGEAEG